MNEFINKLIERLEEESCKAEKNMVASLSNSAANFYSGEAGAYNKTIAIVNQLAEEHNNGWIACSERLPDDFMSFEYLTIRKGHTLATIMYYCVANHKWYSNRNSTREIEVIAWQPLPTPYQPKGE